MPLEQLANLAEVFGILVVAITLIFLTVQMRQNTRALRSTTAQAATDQSSGGVYLPLAQDAALLDVMLRGMGDPSDLTELEMAQFVAFWQHAMFILQNWFYQWREGALEEGFWSGWFQIMVNNYQAPGFKTFWEQRSYSFSPEFRNYFDEQVATTPPTPDFRPLHLLEA